MISVACVTTTPFPDDSSAAGNRCLGVARGLVENGVTTVILSARMSARDVCRASILGIDCYSMRGHPVGGERLSAWVRLRFCFFLWRYLRTHEDCRILWCLGWRGINMLLIKLVAHARGAIVIQEINEFPMSLLLPKQNVLQRLNAWADVHFASYLADGMTLMTRRLMEYYGAGKSQCKMIHFPMTVDVHRFDGLSVVKEGDRYIAYCGSMNGDKDGVSDLIVAFAQIAREFPDVNLRLFGDADEVSMRRLHDLVERMDVVGRVIFEGRIPSSEIPAILVGAEALALIRPNNIQAQGGFPTKLGEYLCAAIPVVVTKVGEIPCYLSDRENAYLCEPSCPEDAAKCFREILVHPAHAAEVGQKGRGVAIKSFNGSIQARDLYQFAMEIFREKS